MDANRHRFWFGGVCNKVSLLSQKAQAKLTSALTSVHSTCTLTKRTCRRWVYFTKTCGSPGTLAMSIRNSLISIQTDDRWHAEAKKEVKKKEKGQGTCTPKSNVGKSNALEGAPLGACHFQFHDVTAMCAAYGLGLGLRLGLGLSLLLPRGVDKKIQHTGV